MPVSYQALIFDLDGVIIDSEPLHERAKDLVFARYDLHVPHTVYDAFKGKTDRDIIEYVAGLYADRNLDIDELTALKQRTYRELMGELILVPGARAFVRQARAHVPRFALTTSAVRKNQQLAFDKFALATYFDVIVTAEDITRPKPDPEPYQITVARLGVDPAGCLVIEDSANGVRSAIGAGCRVAGLTTTFEADVLRSAGAHLIVDGFADLAQHMGMAPLEADEAAR